MIRKVFFILIVLCIECRCYSLRSIRPGSKSFDKRQLFVLPTKEYRGIYCCNSGRVAVQCASAVTDIDQCKLYEVTRSHDIRQKLQQWIVSIHI